MIDQLSASATGTLVMVGFVLALMYAGSLVVHPYRMCFTCKGKARHFGVVFTSAHRMCGACGGKGRTLRPMARLFRSE